MDSSNFTNQNQSLSPVNPSASLDPNLGSDQSATSTIPPDNLANSPKVPVDIDALIAQSLLDQPAPTPVQPLVSTPNKEILQSKPNQEIAPLQEIVEDEPLPVEVEGWLQKLETAGEIRLPEPITHDGQVLLSEPENQVVKEKLVLPISQQSLNQGLVLKVTDSARWLAEWCVRLVKKVNGAVIFVND